MTGPSVGFIGLGSQGGPMARRIVESGYPLTIWARRPVSLEPFAGGPATPAGSPAEVGAASDVVGICVVADADVEEVVLGSEGVLAGMSAGGVVAIHSTVHPDTCVRLARQAETRGVAVIDAPVSGGGHAAAQRQLLVMVGGDEEPVARCRPVFETFGDPVLHLGSLGAGQLAKVVNNLVFTAQVALGLDTFALGEQLGMDKGALATVLASGSGGSRAVSILAGMDFDLSGLGRAAPLLYKDIGIALDVLSIRGESVPASLKNLYQAAFETLGQPVTDIGLDSPSS